MNHIPLTFRSSISEQQHELLNLLTLNLADEILPFHELSKSNRQCDTTLLTGSALNLKTAQSYHRIQNTMFIAYNLQLAMIKLSLFVEVLRNIAPKSYSRHIESIDYIIQSIFDMILELWSLSSDNQEWQPHGDSF